jgi:hypothetical protein
MPFLAEPLSASSTPTLRLKAPNSFRFAPSGKPPSYIPAAIEFPNGSATSMPAFGTVPASKLLVCSSTRASAMPPMHFCKLLV